MDRLVVLDACRIVKQGSREALLPAGGLYAQLWQHQSGGFLGDGLSGIETGQEGDPVESPGEPSVEPPPGPSTDDAAVLTRA